MDKYLEVGGVSKKSTTHPGYLKIGTGFEGVMKDRTGYLWEKNKIEQKNYEDLNLLWFKIQSIKFLNRLVLI